MFRVNLRQILLLTVLVAILFGLWQTLQTLSQPISESKFSFKLASEFAVSPDGSSVASIYGSGVDVFDDQMKLKKQFSLDQFKVPTGRDTYLWKASFVSNQKLLVRVATEGKRISLSNATHHLFIADIETGEIDRQGEFIWDDNLRGLNSEISGGKWIVQWSEKTGKVNVYDLDGNQTLQFKLDGDLKNCYLFFWQSESPNELTFIQRFTVKKWMPGFARNQRSRTRVQIFDLAGQRVTDHEFKFGRMRGISHDGSLLFISFHPGPVEGSNYDRVEYMLWDCRRKEVYAKLPKRPQDISVFRQFSADGKFLALLKVDHQKLQTRIDVYSIPEKKIVGSIRPSGRTEFESRFRISSNNRLFVKVYAKGFRYTGHVVQIWDLETQTLLQQAGEIAR